VFNRGEEFSIVFWLSRRALMGMVAGLVWGAVGAGTATVSAAGPRVQVRGSSRIELHAVGPSRALRVSGVLRDEVGTPISNAAIALSAIATANTSLDWMDVRPCHGGGPSTPELHAEHPVQADDYGAFCVEGVLGVRQATIRAVFGGDALHEGTRAEVRWDAGLQTAAVAFAPRPDRLDLDAPRIMVFGRLIVPAGVSAAQREVMLDDGAGKVLGTAKTEQDGTMHFDLASASVDGPGVGRLRLRFGGSDELTAAEETVAVVRSSRVRLQVDGSALHGDPIRGVEMVVRATTGRGVVDGGTVEVSWGNAAVGVGRVVGGKARVVATFTPTRDMSQTELTLRYAPEAPFYEAGPSVPVLLTIARPRVWWRVFPVMTAAFVLAWLLRGWRRPSRRADVAVDPPRRVGEPSLEVVGAARARSTWTGRVVDAHDGKGIAGARVRVIAPSFRDLDVLAEVTTSADGTFSFEVQSAEHELQLRVDAPFHAEITRPLPPASELLVAMVSRKRALLDRLVGWARRAGRPWDRTPEPTPGHVARVAMGQRHPRHDIGTWARRLEHGVYGPEQVDAAVEREVMALEPGGPPVR
jgi:hypothetical protein